LAVMSKRHGTPVAGRRRTDRRGHLVPAILAGALSCALAACGAASASQPKYVIRTSTIAGLGRVLVDGGGYTLYMYWPDHQGRSTCYRFCSLRWPPLLLPRGVRHAVAGAGLDAALLGTTKRDNGSVQVTYNKWPLYLYDTDLQPGQATGQGDDMGLWYVLAPNGSIDRQVIPGT
jgi:predicted lipoprotein with Yx(FWY)xxD motif